MKIINRKGIILLSTFIFGLFMGFVYHKYEIFPYKLIRNYYHSATRLKSSGKEIASKTDNNFYNLWSIGIYEGTDPFNLKSAENVNNPIMTAEDVTDIDASYVADPFILYQDDTYFLFFEVYNWETHQGDISYATSEDGISWDYQKTILDEKYHLSYPYVFKWQNDYYLIPESNEDLSVRIYKAKSFPTDWEYQGNLISGYHFIDPSIVYYKNKWWLFVASVPDDGVVNLYYSDDLFTGWIAHPQNPIIKLDKHIARPGGRLLKYDNNLYRLAQDCYIEYGQQVFAFKIVELSETTYKEEIVSKTPIVTRSGVGWNAAGMHHLDLQFINDKWYGVTDGKSHSELKNNLPKQH